MGMGMDKLWSGEGKSSWVVKWWRGNCCCCCPLPSVVVKWWIEVLVVVRGSRGRCHSLLWGDEGKKKESTESLLWYIPYISLFLVMMPPAWAIYACATKRALTAVLGFADKYNPISRNAFIRVTPWVKWSHAFHDRVFGRLPTAPVKWFSKHYEHWFVVIKYNEPSFIKKSIKTKELKTETRNDPLTTHTRT